MNVNGKILACKLTAPELQKRRATIIDELKDLVLKKEKLKEGLKLTFPGEDEVLNKLIDFIKFERICCEFLTFHLSIARETATLEIAGPEGTAGFLEDELGF